MYTVYQKKKKQEQMRLLLSAALKMMFVDSEITDIYLSMQCL